LTKPEIEAVLDWLQTHANEPWIYPMACFAGHTGARRSELIRSQRPDWDFGVTPATVEIRERKRVRGTRSTRRSPVSPRLESAMKQWFLVHPGGLCTFARTGRTKYSYKVRQGPAPVTKGEATNYLRHALTGSGWEMIRGWHT